MYRVRHKMNLGEEMEVDVPHRFQIKVDRDAEQSESGKHLGNRFPTMETAENMHGFQARGLSRVAEHSFPVNVPAERRIDPYFREYIYFLNTLDPARFSHRKIGERYNLKEKTVRAIVKEQSWQRYLAYTTGLTSYRLKQITKERAVLDRKEQKYAEAQATIESYGRRGVNPTGGYDQLGDEDVDSESDEEFESYRHADEWVRLQAVEVESMSAYPMMEKREPMPKRVDVDLVVDQLNAKRHFGYAPGRSRPADYKIINWVDPTDKVSF